LPQVFGLFGLPNSLPCTPSGVIVVVIHTSDGLSFSGGVFRLAAVIFAHRKVRTFSRAP